jgi:hypothetical protein
MHFSVRGKARYATQDVEVKLVLPEVAAAKRSNWTLVNVPLGDTLPAEIGIRKSFSAGERFDGEATVVVPEAGYYHAIATVIQRSDERTTDQGVIVGSGAGREVWIWVSEDGGRITDQFDPTLFAEGTRMAAGPLGEDRRPPRIRHGDVVITCTIMAALPLEPNEPKRVYSYSVSATECPAWPIGEIIPPTSPPSATALVTVVYSDIGAGGVTRPVVDARYTWRVANTLTGGTVATGVGFTNTSGMTATINCQGPTSERSVEVIAQTVNSKTEVKNYIANLPDRTQVARFNGACGGSLTAQANGEQAHLFANMNKNYDGHQRFFGAPPRLMRAGMYPVSTYGSRYDWNAEDVHIEPAWDHIWREHGVMVAAHEWAHLWQDQYLFKYPATNGLMRYYNGACTNPHPPGHYSNFGCAFAEAFADWYATVTRESDLPTWRSDLETNRLFEFHCAPMCTDDGSIVQGAVSNLLWDIYDANGNEQHDRVQVPASNIVNAVKDCEVSVNRVDWRAYTGIDHVIWCMERRFPYQVRMARNSGQSDTLMTYFNTRPANQWANDARGFSPAAISDDFRRLWLVDLYFKRQYVGRTGGVFRVVLPEDPTEEPTEPTPIPEPDCQLTWEGCLDHQY